MNSFLVVLSLQHSIFRALKLLRSLMIVADRNTLSLGKYAAQKAAVLSANWSGVSLNTAWRT